MSKWNWILPKDSMERFNAAKWNGLIWLVLSFGFYSLQMLNPFEIVCINQSILPSLKPNSLPLKINGRKTRKMNLLLGYPIFRGNAGFRECNLSLFVYPIGSMYGIFTYIWLKFMVNVGKYIIMGIVFDENQHQSWSSLSVDGLNLGWWS